MKTRDSFSKESKYYSIDAKGKFVSTFFYYVDKYSGVLAVVLCTGLVFAVINAFFN